MFGETPPIDRTTVLGVLDAVSERAGDIEEGNPDVEVAVGELKEAVKLAGELVGSATPAFALAVYQATYGAYEPERNKKTGKLLPNAEKVCEALILAEIECLRENWEKVVGIGRSIFGDACTHLLGLTVYALTYGEYEDEVDIKETISELQQAQAVSERAFGPEGRSPEVVLEMYGRMFGEDDE